MGKLLDEDVLIEALNTWNSTKLYLPIDFRDLVLALPSAQPEKAIKDCRNCKHGRFNDHYGTAFCYNPDDCVDWNLWEPQNLPSVQPERKKGRWIKKMRVTETEKYTSYDPEWYCACCGAKYDSHIAKIVNFCYVCGADMRGEQDE